MEFYFDVLYVVLWVLGIDRDIVDIVHASLIQVRAEGIVARLLERGGGVAKIKRHDDIFELAVPGIEGNFSLAAFLKSDRVISVSQIDLCEDCCFFEPINAFLNAW